MNKILRIYGWHSQAAAIITAGACPYPVTDPHVGRLPFLLQLPLFAFLLTRCEVRSPTFYEEAWIFCFAVPPANVAKG